MDKLSAHFIDQGGHIDDEGAEMLELIGADRAYKWVKLRLYIARRGGNSYRVQNSMHLNDGVS